MSGRVLAVCVSTEKGMQKHPVDHIVLKENWGIDGDAHAGTWHRQVSLLGREGVDDLQGKLKQITLKPGDFAENILTEGITLYTLPVGARLQVGTALCQITQIGKTCHQDCAIRKLAGDCVMPRQGVFVRVLSGGAVRAGDAITVLPACNESL